MKRMRKKVVGLIGLILVIAMTAFAATLPDNPRASATTGEVVTDTLQIRVTGETPIAKFVIPEENVNTTDPNQSYKIDYENLNTLTIKMVYTNEAGEPSSEIILGEYTGLDYYANSITNDLNLSNYGYGKFVLSVYGTGASESEMYLDGISFMYAPIVVSAEQNEDDGLVDAHIEMYGDDVETVDIYFEGEFLQTVKRSDFNETIKISLEKLGTGYYNLVFIAKNALGEVLGSSYKALFYYSSVSVPDTGGFLQNLNISRDDYLITTLIVFLTISITTFVIIVKRSKKSR